MRALVLAVLLVAGNVYAECVNVSPQTKRAIKIVHESGAPLPFPRGDTEAETLQNYWNYQAEGQLQAIARGIVAEAGRREVLGDTDAAQMTRIRKAFPTPTPMPTAMPEPTEAP